MDQTNLYQLNPNEIMFYSTATCGDCRRARAVFAEKNIAYREIDIDEDERASQFVKDLNNGFESVPTIVFPDGSKMVEPSTIELTEKLSELSKP